jgi:ketosteroid isomerase-like protein
MVKSVIMKNTFSVLAAMCLIALGTLNSRAQTINNKPVKTNEMETVKQSKEIVKGFFNAFGKGDFNGIISSFHDSCTIMAVRKANRTGSQIYGTYQGKGGAKTFISNLRNAFDTKAFSVDHVISEGNITFANGKFTHTVKSSGKSFSSDWALMCVIKDDKIFEYHFYEDSERFSEANK